MPEIVAHGRRPEVRACALCHYPNGKGRAENAPISGYPAAYFIQQMNDFKNGDRKSADPRKANTNAMIAIAKAMTDEEIKATADYFGSMPWTPWIKVVETEMVPKTRISGGLFLALDGARKGTARQAHHRGAGEHRSLRDVPQPALGLHRLRAAGQHQEGRGAGEFGRRQDLRAAPATARI